MSSRPIHPRRPTRHLFVPLASLALVCLGGVLAGCSGGSSGDAAPSASAALTAGATCPTPEEFARLSQGALGTGGEQSFENGKIVCDGEWAATTFTVDGAGGRVALKWDGTAWTPVLVGGGVGPCPATVKSAPDDVRTVLAC